MKPLLSFVLLAFALASPAFAADSCQEAIAKSIQQNDSLKEILAGITADDVYVAPRADALYLASGLVDGADLVEALRKHPEAKAYQPGFHLLYVAIPGAIGHCRILAVGQGD